MNEATEVTSPTTELSDLAEQIATQSDRVKHCMQVFSRLEALCSSQFDLKMPTLELTMPGNFVSESFELDQLPDESRQWLLGFFMKWAKYNAEAAWTQLHDLTQQSQSHLMPATCPTAE